jgi:hypothetical protein
LPRTTPPPWSHKPIPFRQAEQPRDPQQRQLRTQTLAQTSLISVIPTGAGELVALDPADLAWNRSDEPFWFHYTTRAAARVIAIGGTYQIGDRHPKAPGLYVSTLQPGALGPEELLNTLFDGTREIERTQAAVIFADSALTFSRVGKHTWAYSALANTELGVRVRSDLGLYARLNTEQIRTIREPWTVLDGPRKREYPLNTGEVARITATSPKQIRTWEETGLLPAYWIAGRRHFFSAALVYAFLLKDLDRNEIRGAGRRLSAEPNDPIPEIVASAIEHSRHTDRPARLAALLARHQ